MERTRGSGGQEGGSPSFSLAFGPVTSRRLGRSVGVNVVPFKQCTYSCVYCQLGPTTAPRTRRAAFFDPEDVAREVDKVLRAADGGADAVTVLGEGEPTLASNLAEILRELRKVWDGRIALISNGSQLYKPPVRRAASGFDVVSVNVSAGDGRAFRRLHRPAKGLAFDLVMEGIRRFARSYGGELWTETMLVSGVNDSPDQLRSIRTRLESVGPDVSFLTVPTRPPSSPWVQPPSEQRYREALEILDLAVDTHRPEGAFPQARGGAVTRLLRISEMHPLREEQAIGILGEGRSDTDARSVLASLVSDGRLTERSYRGARYYSRKR